MRRVWIEALRVDGFGHFRGLDLPLTSGLNLISGENEAGKSTLLAFLRAMLFGFPSRSHPERYEPEEGPYGGAITLITPQGPWVVRRARGKQVAGEVVIRSAGDRIVPESQLQELLGVSRALHQQLFAFGLGELASFEALARERSVSEALSASAMPGARRLPEAIAALGRSCGELYSPRGQKPEINALLAGLKQLQEELAVLGDVPRAYGELLERRGGLERRAAQLEEEIRAGQAECAQLERLERAAPELLRAWELEAQLALLPSRPDFPEAASARWRELEAHGARQQEALAAHREKVRSTGAELSGVCARLRPEPEGSALRAALAAYRGRAQRLTEAPLRRRQWAERRAQLKVGLESLGLGITLDRLPELDLAPAARTELGERRQALALAQAAGGRADEELEAARQERERLAAEASEVEHALASLPAPASGELHAQELAVARVPALRAERSRLEERVRELSHRLALPAPALRRPRLALTGAMAAAAALLLVLASVAAWVLAGRGVGAVALGVALLLSAAVAWVQQRLAADHREAVAEVEAAGARHQAEASRLGAERAAGSEALAQVELELEEALRLAGLPPGADALTVARRQQEIAGALRGQQRRDELALRLSRVRPEAERARREAALREEAAARAGAGRAQALAALDGWLQERGLAASGAPELAVERVLACAALQDQARALAEEARAEEVEAADDARAVEAMLRAARELGVPGADAQVAAAEVERAIREQEGWTREKVRLEAQRVAAAEALALCEQEGARLEQARAGLLRAAGCEEGAVLLAREQEQLQRRALEREQAELAHRIAGNLQRTVAQAREQLRARGGPDEVARHRALEAERVAALRAERDAAVDAAGQLKAQLVAIEQGERLRGLRAEEERLRARLQERIEAYAVERTALAVLEQERARHQQAQQPRLLAGCSTLLERLTRGRWVRVLAPEAEGAPLRVRHADGSERTAEVLSRGTREQLFLALRIAVIRDLAERRAPVPLIVDDVLVNFDPVRAREAVAVFAELAQTHQVLAFTCHPAIRAMFEAERARVIPLEAGPEQPRVAVR